MVCEGCERRRREMALLLEASKLWTLNPLGPQIPMIFKRLREEAIARGEMDDGPLRPIA